MKSNWNVLFVCVICVSLCATQNDNTTDICELCDCPSNAVADCAGKGFIAFGEDFWKGTINHGELEEINLSKNNIKKLFKIPELAIVKLNVSRCGLEYIEEACFSLLLGLKHLDLSYNDLATNDINVRVFLGQINPELKLFSDMTSLDISYNNLHSLNQDVFNFMPNLRMLSLSGNPLVIVDQVTMAAVSSLAKLGSLYLRDCRLESLPEGFLRRQFKLEYLDISANNFNTIPAALSDATNLVYLNLNKNPIALLEKGNALSQLSKLEALHLRNMTKLEVIGAEALGGLRSLRVLDLSWNPRLGTVSPDALLWSDDHDVEKWPDLEELYLNNNNLTEIDPHLLSRWDQLATCDAGHNPFVCDCGAKWTVKVLLPIIAKMEASDTSHMVCQKPPAMRGVPLQTLTDRSDELTCEEKNRDELIEAVSAEGTVILIGVMIGIFLTFPLVLVIVLLWKRGACGRLRRSFQEEYVVDELDAGLEVASVDRKRAGNAMS